MGLLKTELISLLVSHQAEGSREKSAVPPLIVEFWGQYT
jgi:hypothetical protein